MSKPSKVFSVLIIGAGVAVAAGPAAAKIACDGSYQIVRGQPISTPYCQDAYLAVVVREYGMRVSASTIRSSPSVKAQACRLVGVDNRTQVACAGHRDQPFQQRRF